MIPIRRPGPALLYLMDLPLLDASETPGAPRFAAFAKPWQRVHVFRSPGASGYVLDRRIPSPSILGLSTADFYSGPLWRWDIVNTLYVQLHPDQALSSIDDDHVLAGGNPCALRNADGQWEILQFANADLIGGGQYKLTRLLRGQLGSEYAMRDPVASGAAFVMLDETVRQASIDVRERGNAWNWKWGPGSRTIDDASYQTASLTFAGVGLQPYAPAHLSATWDADGNVQLAWVRRTRIDGDNWTPPEVPVGEEEELYDVEILNAAGTSVLRTVSGLGGPGYRYDSGDQTTDFGAPIASIKFNVYQRSADFGRGAVASY